MFQFYLSSIKRNIHAIHRISELCFNSTLVQLKGNCSFSLASNHSCFNSTLVQLKDVRAELKETRNYSFNSTLVQLKEYLFSLYFT